MHEFHIKRLPVLALTDERGRPYAIETRFESGFSRLAEKLDVWRKQRAERDRLLAAAEQGSETEQLAAAAAAVAWMQERGIWQFYQAEIRKWAELASRVDPANERRLLEAFFEPQWLLEAGEANPSDEVDVGRLVEELQPWTSRKFGNADRGAKLHLAAARLLTDAQRFDEATAQLEHAVAYQPNDAQLAGAVRNARQFLDNRDVQGSGSGFLVSADGHILTNQHVVAGAGPTVIRIPNSKDTLPAEIVAQDANQDLALLKINVPKAGTFTPLALKGSPLRRGTAVALFGYPLGDSLGANLKFTAGRISGLPDESSNGMYLLDATVNPGSSGGPLCDQRGNVVGLVSAKTGGSTLEDSYGLAIPAPKLAEFLDRHLPAAISRPLADTNESALDWQLVDERVSGGVLMVVKKRP
jgi:S1-C subfamily serine protease